MSRANEKTSTLIVIKEIEVCNYRDLILLSGLVDDGSPPLGSPGSVGDKTSSRNRAAVQGTHGTSVQGTCLHC